MNRFQDEKIEVRKSLGRSLQSLGPVFMTVFTKEFVFQKEVGKGINKIKACMIALSCLPCITKQYFKDREYKEANKSGLGKDSSIEHTEFIVSMKIIFSLIIYMA